MLSPGLGLRVQPHRLFCSPPVPERASTVSLQGDYKRKAFESALGSFKEEIAEIGMVRTLCSPPVPGRSFQRQVCRGPARASRQLSEVLGLTWLAAHTAVVVAAFEWLVARAHSDTAL